MVSKLSEVYVIILCNYLRLIHNSRNSSSKIFKIVLVLTYDHSGCLSNEDCCTLTGLCYLQINDAKFQVS
jgi:hypothetical protein